MRKGKNTAMQDTVGEAGNTLVVRQVTKTLLVRQDTSTAKQ